MSLWDESEYRREAVIAAVGATGLTMNVEQVAEETGLDDVAAELDLLAEKGLIGRIGDGKHARYFPCHWLKKGAR
jgi:hypothetical protein